MLKSMFKMRGFLQETELLKYTCTEHIHAASLQGSWKGLAVPCSTLLSGCFQFSNLHSLPAITTGYWQGSVVVKYFVKILHVTCSSLK